MMASFGLATAMVNSSTTKLPSPTLLGLLWWTGNMKKCVCVCSFVGLGQQRSILVGSRMGYVMNECVEVMGIGLCCEYMAYGGTSTTGADERTSFLKNRNEHCVPSTRCCFDPFILLILVYWFPLRAASIEIYPARPNVCI